MIGNKQHRFQPSRAFRSDRSRQHGLGGAARTLSRREVIFLFMTPSESSTLSALHLMLQLRSVSRCHGDNALSRAYELSLLRCVTSTLVSLDALTMNNAICLISWLESKQTFIWRRRCGFLAGR